MDLKKFALALAKQAGEIIRKDFKFGMKKQWKGNNTPVTQTDIAINKLVISQVKKYFQITEYWVRKRVIILKIRNICGSVIR